MPELLEKLPQAIKGLIQSSSDTAQELNYNAYLVGGFVRDLILGVKNLDLDIVVEGQGIVFATELGRRLSAEVITHKKFGTATVIVPQPVKRMDKGAVASIKIDIATAREEFYQQPAVLPTVRGSVIKDDLGRRDFTINAMAISISRADCGRFIDFFHGRDDIRRRSIRVLHDLSFIDDPTRIFRAIRFEQRFNFHLEPRTLKLLKKALALKMLERLSPHRLRAEMILIFKEERPLKYIRRINKLVGFSFLSPHLKFTHKTERLLGSIESQIKWFKNRTPGRRPLDTWLIYMIALINDMPLKYIKEFCLAFGFTKGERKRILSCKNTVDKTARKLKLKLKPSHIHRCLEPLSYEVILLINAKYQNLTLRKNVKDFFNIYNGVKINTGGEDLAKLKIPPGPSYKKILEQTLYAKLDKKISSKKEELEFIKGLIRGK
jgi:tRNA nucleotidyltransferase (CCA-adding enzyme)